MTEDIRVEFMSGPGSDPAEIDALTRALRDEILEVDEVDRVEQGCPFAGSPTMNQTRRSLLSVIGVALPFGIGTRLGAASTPAEAAPVLRFRSFEEAVRTAFSERNQSSSCRRIEIGHSEQVRAGVQGCHNDRPFAGFPAGYLRIVRTGSEPGPLMNSTRMSSVMPRAPSVATEATHPAAWAGAAVAGCRKSAATWPPALDDLDITGMGRTGCLVCSCPAWVWLSSGLRSVGLRDEAWLERNAQPVVALATSPYVSVGLTGSLGRG